MSTHLIDLTRKILSHPDFDRGSSDFEDLRDCSEPVLTPELWTLITFWSLEFKNYCMSCDYWIEISVRLILNQPGYQRLPYFEELIEKWCLITKQTNEIIEGNRWHKLGKLLASMHDVTTIRTQLIETIERINIQNIRIGIRNFETELDKISLLPNVRVDSYLIEEWGRISRQINEISRKDWRSLCQTTLLNDAILVQKRITDSIWNSHKII